MSLLESFLSQLWERSRIILGSLDIEGDWRIELRPANKPPSIRLRYLTRYPRTPHEQRRWVEYRPTFLSIPNEEYIRDYIDDTVHRFKEKILQQEPAARDV